MKTVAEIDARLERIREKWKLYDNLKEEKRDEVLPGFNPVGATIVINILEEMKWLLEESKP